MNAEGCKGTNPKPPKGPKKECSRPSLEEGKCGRYGQTHLAAHSRLPMPPDARALSKEENKRKSCTDRKCRRRPQAQLCHGTQETVVAIRRKDIFPKERYCQRKNKKPTKILILESNVLKWVLPREDVPPALCNFTQPGIERSLGIACRTAINTCGRGM